MTQLDDIYQEESEKLAVVIRAIQDQTESLRSRMPVYADYARTADAIQKVLQSSADTLDAALEQPYFGRVDFLSIDPSERSPRTIYVGSAHIPETGVVSWVAPVAHF